ncbi:MAG: hypothetical protein MJ058_04195 [Akkermansia sp.]|nr:hypothetical protein [Akkermansia sp.]
MIVLALDTFIVATSPAYTSASSFGPMDPSPIFRSGATAGLDSAARVIVSVPSRRRPAEMRSHSLENSSSVVVPSFRDPCSMRRALSWASYFSAPWRVFTGDARRILSLRPSGCL